MTTTEAAEIIDLLINRAPKLRAAGVLELDLGDFAVTLRSLEPDAEPEAPVVEETKNMWNDPATYGGGVVPGTTRKEHK